MARLNDTIINGDLSATGDITTQGAISAQGTIITYSDIKAKNIDVTEDISVDGDILVEGMVEADNFNATSDARLKENFESLTLEKSILDLPIYKFDFIKGAKNQIGCKAQDLQEICPEIVHERKNGYLSIQESKIVYLLLDELKKLRKEVDALKAQR